MSRHNLKIRKEGPGGEVSLSLDGHPISPAAIQLSMDPDNSKAVIWFECLDVDIDVSNLDIEKRIKLIEPE